VAVGAIFCVAPSLVVIFGLTPILGIFVSVLAGKLLTDD
jgi:hypothetical protein